MMIFKKSKKNWDFEEETPLNWFELQGTSFVREDSRDAYLDEFQSILASTPQGLLYVFCEEVVVDFENHTYHSLDTRFFVKGNIPQKFLAEPCEDPLAKRPPILSENPDHLITEKGYAKVFVAYRYPSHLPEGFLYSVFGIAKEIALKWQKIPTQKLLNTLELSITRKSRLGSLSDSPIISNMEEMINSIRNGLDVINITLFFTVTAPSKSELDEKSRELQFTLKAYGIEVEAPRFYQRYLYNFETELPVFNFKLFSLKRTLVDTYSARSLYPLIKESFVDEGGVFLGFSGTGDPIVFNPYKRHNYLMLILGETGSGKSMTSKIYLHRLYEKTKIPVYGVDPENEYTRISDYFGSGRVIVAEDTQVGFDPLKMDLDRTMVAEVLSEVYSIPPNLRPRFRKEFFSTTAKDIFEFVSTCEKEFKKYLEPILSPPDSFIFSGKQPNLSSPLIFGLREVRSEHLKILLTSLISIYLSQRMMQSVVFVDEGWLFIKTPRIMNVFENIARRGRKYGMHFIFITQRVEDVASRAEGRVLLEQASSVLLFRQEKEGADAIKHIYKLSEGEVMSLVNASPGEGILKAGNTKLFIRVVPTETEFRLFSTTPIVAR